MRAARDFLRAPVLRCSAPRLTALSIVATSSRCSARRSPVAALDGRLEATEVGLDRRGVAAVLEPLALGAQDALLLRMNVGHDEAPTRDRTSWPAPRQRRTIAALSAAPKPSRRNRPHRHRPTGGGVARNTAIFSIATGISRVAGLVREIVAASFFGTSGPASAFTIAFQVPNLVTQPVRATRRCRRRSCRCSPNCSSRAAARRRSGWPRRCSGSC